MQSREEDVLIGWKEIADYMRKSVRTCHRWARAKGLPVSQPAGPGTEPYASKRVLDDWRFLRGDAGGR